jgi:predicted metal-binding membrane protein
MIYDARDCARLRLGVLLTSAVAWAAMVAVPGVSCHCRTYASGAALGQLLASQSSGSLAYGWLVMLVAMMGPMTLPALYRIRIGSFVSRRWRSSALFLASYVLVWMVAGSVLTVAELVAKWRAPGSYGPAVVVGLVGLVWQMSPFKQRCLNRCHAHPSLAAFGLAADRDAFKMGLGHGRWCVGSCWAIMLFPMLLPEWHLTAMAAATLVMLCERLEPPMTPTWRLRGFQTAMRWSRMQVFGPRTSPPPYAAAPR